MRRIRAAVAVGIGAVLVIEGAVLIRSVLSQEPGPDSTREVASRRVPAPPAAMPPTGSWVVSTVTRGGDVAVEQWIRAAQPVRSLDLTLDQPGPASIEAESLVVSGVDGSRLAALATVGSTVGSTSTTVTLRTPATSLYLTYVISGLPTDQESTVVGRSLVRVTSMGVAHAGETGPTVRVVRGPGPVLNAACVPSGPAAGTAPTPCGAALPDGGWEVERRGLRRHDGVLAQIEAG